MKKHAYLIMAHNDFDILKKTLHVLDDDYCDFYIHIDKKVKNVDISNITKWVQKSDVFFVKRTNVQWGADSQIKCELLLLEAAVAKGYGYYHIISGVDMPLKTPKEIDAFFENNSGKNYIGFSSDYTDELIKSRLMYYNFLQQKIGRNTGHQITIYRKIDACMRIVQKMLKVNRIKSIKNEIYKGSNWCSITHDLAIYILKQRQFIKKYFYYSLCADEIYKQTIAMNSDFKLTIIKSDLRHIDWKRGKPYVFLKEDFAELVNSPRLFARKFSTEKDNEIIEKLYTWIMDKKVHQTNTTTFEKS